MFDCESKNNYYMVCLLINKQLVELLFIKRLNGFRASNITNYNSEYQS